MFLFQNDNQHCRPRDVVIKNRSHPSSPAKYLAKSYPVLSVDNPNPTLILAEFNVLLHASFSGADPPCGQRSSATIYFDRRRIKRRNPGSAPVRYNNQIIKTCIKCLILKEMTTNITFNPSSFSDLIEST